MTLFRKGIEAHKQGNLVEAEGYYRTAFDLKKSYDIAGNLGGDYSTRAWIYTIAVLWVLVGAVVVFMLAHRGETKTLSVGRVLLWTASIWLWPALALRALARRQGKPPAE